MFEAEKQSIIYIINRCFLHLDMIGLIVAENNCSSAKVRSLRGENDCACCCLNTHSAEVCKVLEATTIRAICTAMFRMLRQGSKIRGWRVSVIIAAFTKLQAAYLRQGQNLEPLPLKSLQ